MNAVLDDIIAKLNQMPPEQKNQVVSEAMSRVNPTWIPNPGPQSDAYYCDADELFYGGQAGGGKSDLLLGLAVTSHEKSLLLREYNEDARALGDRFIEIIGNRDGWNGTLLKYQIPERTIEFGGCKAEGDKQRFKGRPHDLIGFDEVGDFTETQYTFIIAWNRSANPNQRCRIVATGNPPTRAKGLWVIKRWAAWLDPNHPNPAKPGELRWYTTGEAGEEIEVDGAGPHLINGQMVRARSRTFIRAKLEDNPDLAATDYDATLAALPPEMRAAYRDGRFDLSLEDHPFQVVPTDWIRQAQMAWEPHPPERIPMCTIGVDCTGGGKDPMIMAPRYDGWYAPLIEIPGKDIPSESAGRTAAGHVLSHRRDRALVVVDMGGGYGGPLYEHLHENDIETKKYMGTEGTIRRSQEGGLTFYNTRAAAYWLFREALDPNQPGGSPIRLPDDPKLVADLTTPTFEVVSGKIKITPKEKVMEELGRSPDRGDSVVMGWFYGAKEANSALEWAERKERKRGQSAKVVMGRRKR